MPAARIIAARSAIPTGESRTDTAGGGLPATCVPQPTCCGLLQVVDGAAADARRHGDAQVIRFDEDDADASRASCMPIAKAACRPLSWGAIERAAVHVAPALMPTLAAGCGATRTPVAAGRLGPESAACLIMPGGPPLISDHRPPLGLRANVHGTGVGDGAGAVGGTKATTTLGRWDAIARKAGPLSVSRNRVLDYT